MLFQHTLSNSSSYLNANPTPNDYLYLNGKQNTDQNGLKQNGAMPNITDLYSTVNKLNKSHPKLNTDEEIPAQQAPHVPIYDSTTNLQHQRINSLNNRSKTPGPDTIYFRNTNQAWVIKKFLV